LTGQVAKWNSAAPEGQVEEKKRERRKEAKSQNLREVVVVVGVGVGGLGQLETDKVQVHRE